MNNTDRSFDTLQYSKRMQAAGFSEEQAEAQAEEIKILIDNKMATKDDLRQSEERINHRFDGISHQFHEVDQKFINLEERMNHRFNEVNQQFKEVDHRFKEVDYKIKEMGQKIIITLGSMIASSVIILAAFIKLV